MRGLYPVASRRGGCAILHTRTLVNESQSVMTFVILGVASLVAFGAFWLWPGSHSHNRADLGVMSHQWMGEQRMAQSQDPQR